MEVEVGGVLVRIQIKSCQVLVYSYEYVVRVCFRRDWVRCRRRRRRPRCFLYRVLVVVMWWTAGGGCSLLIRLLSSASWLFQDLASTWSMIAFLLVLLFTAYQFTSACCTNKVLVISVSICTSTKH